MTKLLGVVGLLAAINLAAAGFLFWRLMDVEKEVGAAKVTIKTLSDANAAKTAATKDRAQTNQAVRKMAQPEKLEKLK